VEQAPDPILAAIAEHQVAYDAFQIAPDGKDAELAQDEMLEARGVLLSTSCVTLAGCFALIEHLRWFIAEEAVNYAETNDQEWRQIMAREAELAMLLGSKLTPIRTTTGVEP
jgi:hypothetical protein